LFILPLFYGLNIAEYTALKARIMTKQKIERDVEGSGCGLI
jgi:hypothetical protein